MVVLTGRVKISNYSADGKEAVLNFFEPDQVFGEIALLDGKPRTADAHRHGADRAVRACSGVTDILRLLPGAAAVGPFGSIEALCAKLAARRAHGRGRPAAGAGGAASPLTLFLRTSGATSPAGECGGAIPPAGSG